MNKQILIILAILVANQSFADIGATNGVANSATCDSGALDTDSGGAALEAQYTPETINLRWYDDNGTSITTNSCTYDSSITLPNNPTKTGYTFKGWRVVYNLRDLDVSIPATDYLAINNSGLASQNAQQYGLTESGTWVAPFSYGIFYGESLCSSVYGQHARPGNPTNDGGQYCWCKLTKFIPDGQNTTYNVSPSVWVYERPRSNCMDACATHCGYYMTDNNSVADGTYFRTGMFGQYSN